MEQFTMHTARYVVTTANRKLPYTTNHNYLKSLKILTPCRWQHPVDTNVSDGTTSQF